MSTCPYCRGTGRDPLSDNVAWLACSHCHGTGLENQLISGATQNKSSEQTSEYRQEGASDPGLECDNCATRFDPTTPQPFTGLQLCLPCQQEHHLRVSAPLMAEALRQISQASIGITPTRELLLICIETAAQALARATTLPAAAPTGTYYTPADIIEPATGSGSYLSAISGNPPYTAPGSAQP